MRKFLILILALPLMACESESSCYARLSGELNNMGIDQGTGANLVMIYHSDLNVCDYTLLGGSVLVRR